MSDVRAYGQYCPITRAVEVLGERWSVLIVRDLLCGATRFNDLARGNPRLSRSLLSKRLRQLEQAGIVEHVDEEYLLTEAGRDLESVVFGLGEWGAKWQFDDPREHELDVELLMWWVHGRLDFSELPDRRIVLEFRFHDADWYWIVRDSQGPSVCDHDPGFDTDVTIRTDVATMYQVWLGSLSLDAAQRSGRIRLSGAPGIRRRMSDVLELSPIAPVVVATRTARRSTS